MTCALTNQYKTAAYDDCNAVAYVSELHCAVVLHSEQLGTSALALLTLDKDLTTLKRMQCCNFLLMDLQ